MAIIKVDYDNTGDSRGYTKMAVSAATLSTTQLTEVVLGFRPIALATRIVKNDGTTNQNRYVCVYDSRLSTSQYFFSTNSKYPTMTNLGDSSIVGALSAITNTGFIYNKAYNSDYTAMYYFAIG